MPGPAARVGDSTAHGGVISPPGCPTVLIGGMPAARVTDMQICPMVTPAPVPVPHVSGPISGPGVPTVLIGGMPAATIGDMTVCVGPPGIIIIGCPNVLIGTGGSGGAGGGAVKAARDGAHSALVGDQGEGEGPHWKDIQFVDKAGNPITQVPYELTGVDGQKEKYFLTKDGKIRRGNLPKGGQYTVQLFTVYNAKWSQNEARVGDVVKLSADVEGFKDETEALFIIQERDLDGKDDSIVQITSKVQGGKVEAQWKYEYHEDTDKVSEDDEVKGYSAPEHYFIVKVGECKARSDLLEYKDWIEIELVDEEDKPIANEDYLLYLPDGSIRKGKLDGNGYKKEEKIPPGKCSVVFPNKDDVMSLH
jgi:uncharacterized Zn-binding protein involved in type VI secretion